MKTTGKTVGQIAKENNVTPQSVYKRLVRLSSRLDGFVHRDDNGKTYIDPDGERILVEGLKKVGIRFNNQLLNQDSQLNNQLLNRASDYTEGKSLSGGKNDQINNQLLSQLNNHDSQFNNQLLNQDTQFNNQTDQSKDDFIAFLQKEIDVKNKQLDARDEQINDLIKKIEYFQVLIKNEQEIKSLPPSEQPISEGKSLFKRIVRRLKG
jgi:hypothetical protein